MARKGGGGRGGGRGRGSNRAAKRRRLAKADGRKKTGDRADGQKNSAGRGDSQKRSGNGKDGRKRADSRKGGRKHAARRKAGTGATPGRGKPVLPRKVAVVSGRGRFAVAEPLFEPGPQIPLDRRHSASEGHLVWLEFGSGRARVLRDLGHSENARDVCEAMVLEKLGWRGFRPRIESEAAEAAEGRFEPPGGRTDLTDLPTFTVDPATARDFDDAVSARPEGDDVRLWIHIADVAAFVRPGSGLDREAFRRANSTYVPTSVEPMLPAALSNGVCSLAPEVERPAVTTEMLLSPEGQVRSVRFFRSRVRSDVRLSYGELDRIFAGRKTAPEPVAEALGLSRKVAAVLAAKRSEGALEVNSPEPAFEFDGQGNVVAARAETQTEANRLIEQLMVLTNEQVAGHLERSRVPTLYRIHEQPDPDRIEHLLEKLASLGVPTPPLPDGIGPAAAGRLAVATSRNVAREAEARGHGAAAWSSLVLRSLKPARYSQHNLGHAGLGSDAYSHFTSPIRRYADLVVHRGLLSQVGAGEEMPAAAGLEEIAEHCSEREREATRLERDADDVCAAFLLRRELQERGWDTGFEGEVSGVVGAGVFVEFGGELGDVYEGFLPARRLRGEYFALNEFETALVGSRSGRAVRIGDPVTVTVERIETARGRVDLDLVPAADGDR